MRPRHTMTALALLAALGLLAGCDDDDDDGDDDAGVDAGPVEPPDAGPPPAETIAEIAASDPQFSLLVAAAQRAGLVDELDGAGPLTVFAPTNAAFAASGITMEAIETLPVEDLQQLLLYHVIQGDALESDELEEGPALSAAELTLIVGIDEGGVVINNGAETTGGANVVTADIIASNGVIHVIDRVLQPPDIATLAGYANLTTLLQAATTAGLADELSADEPLTVLAPTNEAFAALGTLPTGDDLENVLLYHVLAGEVTSAAIAELEPGVAYTLAPNRFGEPMSVVFDATDDLIVNDTAVIETDLQATNGIVHVVDAVLVPPNVVEMVEYADLTGLLAAIQAAAPLPNGTTLAEALASTGPYTVFAPTDEAFEDVSDTLATLTAEQVRDVLLYHVLDPTTYLTPILAKDLPAPPGGDVVTLLGAPATIETAVVPPQIEDANIVVTDINVTNGVIHLIDAVLVPETLAP
jgi:transforming growth factor-beta-induced protein